MPGKAKYIALLVAALMTALLGAASLNADVTGRPHDLSLTNPRGHCINCHDLHQTGLGEGFAHNLKRANEIAVCYQCHAGTMNDYSSIDPTMPNKTSLYSDYNIRAEFDQTHIHFPTFGMDGEVNRCSYCHNPHGVFNHESTTRKPKLLSAGPDVVTDTDEYCFVCHNDDANPPHSPFPNISVGDQYRFSRTTYKQMTHSMFVRATTVTEPVPDTARTYDDNPYGAGLDISCLTCHRPHGSPNEHMLKLPDDQDLCLHCHDGSKAPSMTRFTTSGHGKAGVDRICQECHFPHGTGQENAVKTTITDPHTGTPTAANVNASGMNEACFACHGTVTAPAAYSSFDSALTNWATGGLTQTVDTATYYLGGGSMKQYRATAASAYSYNSSLWVVSPNTQYTFSVYRNIPAALSGGTSYIYMYEYTSGGSGVKGTTVGTASAATSRFDRSTYTFTTAATTGQLRVYLYLTGAGTVYWDELRLGTASSASYYQGKTAYNAGVHKTSPAAHNPADTTADQAAGDCNNCHDPHGRGYGKMLVDARDQSLCYDCHNASTPNTKTGQDVQAAFAMSSNHDLTKVACVNCHNVHKATQSQAVMDPYDPGMTAGDRTVFCLSCHSGTMPSGVTGAPGVSVEWTGGGHDTTHALSCPDCHEPHGSPNPSNLAYLPRVYGAYTARFASGMGFASRTFCESCHNRTGSGYKGAKKIPTGAGYVGQHEQADGTACSTCHTKKHNPTLGNYTGGNSYYTTSCLNCHKAGVGNPYPDADAEFNTPANGSDANTKKSIHNITYTPPATVDCVTCHGSKHETDHSLTNKLVDPDKFNGISGIMPSAQTSSVFCLECHDATPVTLGGYTPLNIIDTYTSAGHGKPGAREICSVCHQHHGSASEKLLKSSINGSTVLGTYSGNNVTVCTACHAGMDAALPMWPGYSVYSGSIHAYGNTTTGNLVGDGRHGPGVCVNCHNPHGAREAGAKTDAMLYKKDENLCYTCHSSGFDNFSTAGDYNNRWTRFSSSTLSVSKSGGAVRFGRTSVGAGTTFNDGLDYSAAFPDAECTVTVKIKAPEMVRTDGYNYAGLRIFDPVTGNYVHIFYRAHSTPHAWVVRYSNDGGNGGNMPAVPGDIAMTYHTLKMVRNTAAGTVDVYADDTLLRSCTMPRTGAFKVRLFGAVSSTADASPEVMDVWFDDLRVKYADDRTIHNTSSGDDVQMRFYMKSRHAVSDIDQLGPDGLPGTADDAKVECVDCHDPHTVTEKLMAFRSVSGVVVPIEADQDFCLKCHSATPPAGVVFPEEGVWDKSAYDMSAHGNPMARNRTFGNYSNGVLYPCKVCHNPHGSDQSHLQRDSWDINRDGIPDDIDGDGVLDSTMAVGFIGYSSNSRKAILVSEPRPGFQRISSTIPMQENGTVDVELCFNCHDGSPAPDVETDFGKLSHHDVTYADQVASGGSKIECYHCHDQHRAQARNDAAGHYPTTNPDPPREPMPGDAKFCLRCHDNTLPEGVSFGTVQPKNVKLSYNPNDLRDADGYDLITSFKGHYVQSGGAPLLCRECHNQHGSSYAKLIRDDTESGKPNHDPTQHIQGMEPLALRPSETYGGSDDVPLSSTSERCLACHSGRTTYNGNLLPLPPPPDAAERGFSMSPVGKHPDLKAEVTVADEVGGHIYRPTFAIITTPGSIKEECTQCHDSHNPYINTLDGQLMDCYQCHNENTSLPDVQSEFNDNPTNPERSHSIHPVKYDPTGTTPAYVECLKCHDQSRHMQGTVRLRKDPSSFANHTSDEMVWADPVANRTINQFCMECHDPDSTVAASFNRGGTEHVPPRLPAGHTDGAHFVNGTLLCTDCHEYHGSVNKGLRKNVKGDQETFCYSCHANPANSVNGVNVQAKFAGSSHHDVAAADQAAKGGRVECEDCHNPHVVTRTNPVVDADDRDTAAPADDSFCIGCHDSNAAAGIKFPGYSTGMSDAEWNTSTGKWNKWNKSAYAGSSHETGGITCKKCHDPHGSPNYAILLQNISSTSGVSVGFGTHSTARGKRTEELGVNNVCAACHKASMGVYGGYPNFTSLTFGHKKGIDKNCTYCHNPHGTAQANLMRAAKPLYMNASSTSFGSVYNFKGFANSTTGAPLYSFCSSASCHPSERAQFNTFSMDLAVDNFSHVETASSHHPIKEGTIGCTSCHNEHGSANAPGLRAPYYRESNWPELFHSGRGVYSAYHRPGVGDPFDGTNYFEKATSGLPDNTNRNKVTTVSPPSNANDLCFMCHQQDDVIGTTFTGMTGTNTKFIGHEAVKGGARVSRNIAKNTTGTGDYHNFSCSMCHFPHSAQQSKLLKTSCMSQADNQAPNATYGTIFACHAFTKWSNYNAGWRNLTTAKADFKRPPNAVTDLDHVKDADLTVHLNWNAVSDQPGVGAHHYNVYRSSQSITQATKQYATRIYKGVAGASPGQAVSWTDYTGQPNTTYYYAVVACDSENNESFVSNCVTVALGADTINPNAVANQQTAQIAGTYNVKLTWSDPADNVNVTQYKVYRIAGLTPLASGDLIAGNLITTKTDTSLSTDGSADAVVYTHTDTVPQLGQDYSYAVVALDAAGLVSALPTGSTFSVSIVDPAPANVTTLAVKPVTNQMKATLTWTAPTNVGTISGYNVYRKAGSALTQSDVDQGATYRIGTLVAGLTWTDESVQSVDTTYYYTVTAVDESSSKESLLGNVPTLFIPSAPGGLAQLALQGSCYQLSWAAPSYTTGLSSYKVYRRRSGGSWTPVTVADNLVPNPGFDEGTTRWNAATLTATGTYYDGKACVKLTGTAAGDKYIETDLLVQVKPSASYTFTGYVRVPTSITSGNTSLRVIEYNASGGYVTEHVATGFTTTSGWQLSTDTWTTNANTAQLRLRVNLTGIGTAYWDSLRLVSGNIVTTAVKADMTGLEPGSYEFAVTANYGTYGGTTPYESVISATIPTTLTDTLAPQAASVSGALISPSNTQARLSWNAPSDNNYSGYSPAGLNYYRVEASYNQGVSWGAVLRTLLTNHGFETHAGTVDDATTDTFTDWTITSTNAYAVSDSLLESKAVKIRWTGSGTGSISATEPSAGASVANRQYSMSFWAKANKSANVSYSLQANGGNNERIDSPATPVGTSWQRYTLQGTFSGSATATRAKAVVWTPADTTVEVTVDGVRLESGESAVLANDGSFYRPAGYDTPATPLTFDDPNTLTPGTSVIYRLKSVDLVDNITGTVYAGTVYARPTTVSDISVASSTTKSANVVSFSSSSSLAGVQYYDVYTKEQGTALTSGDLVPGNLIGSFAAAYPSGDNRALTATGSASGRYDAYNYLPATANDGVNTDSSTWRGQQVSTPQWLELNFGSSIPLYKVSLYFYSGSQSYRPKDFLIQTWDGAAWVTQNTVTGNSAASVTYTFSKAIATSKVRMYLTQTYGGLPTYYPIVDEFMAYTGEMYVHDIQNTTLMAEVGHTYAYAVLARDVNSVVSGMSGGNPTVKAVTDKDAPDKVTDLALSTPVGTTQAILTWSTPLDNQGHGTGIGATQYKVYRLPTSSVGTPVPVTDDNYGSATLVYTGTYASGTPGTPNSYTATWYDHKGVYYAVTSADSAGNWSKVSNSPYIVVGKDGTAPVPPVITDCSSVTTHEVDVYWTPATDDVGINGYRMFRANVDIEPFLTDQCITENNIDQAEVAVSLIPYNAVSASDPDALPGTTYYFALRAWDNENNMSNISNCAVGTVLTEAADAVAPIWGGTPLVVTAGQYPAIDLVWDAASDLDDLGGVGNIDHYDVYRSLSTFTAKTDPGVTKVATVAGIRGSYVDVTGDPATAYYYGLVAADASSAHNQSALSNVGTATVASMPSPDNTPPTVPGILAASTGVYPAMNLTWSASTDVDDSAASQPLNYYKLYVSDYPLDITDANKDNPAEVRTIFMAHDAVSYAARGISGQRYNFRLEAFDLAGNASGMGSQANATVATAPCADTTVPTAPASLAATVGPSPDMALSWTASTDQDNCATSRLIDHYRLYKVAYEITSSTDLRTITPIYIAGSSTTNTDSTGAPNTQYWYVLTAVDSAGNESGKSNIITKSTAADTMAPAAVADLNVTQDAPALNLAWSRPSDNVGVDHYEIYRKEQATILTDGDVVPGNKLADFTNAGQALSYDDGAVTSGLTYSYAVIAVDGAGNRSTISRGKVAGDTYESAP
ncbi:MAG: discoidin domain-containing protein [Nitrospirae bacterium]|nr:discoidin domain-containing protein [Nitrospirota bacterium]